VNRNEVSISGSMTAMCYRSHWTERLQMFVAVVFVVGVLVFIRFSNP